MNFLQFDQIFDIAGHHPLELAACRFIQLLAKTIYRVRLLSHIQTNACVVPTVISQNVACIVHTKNTIKMNKILDDESDTMIDDDAGLKEEEDVHGRCVSLHCNVCPETSRSVFVRQEGKIMF